MLVVGAIIGVLHDVGIALDVKCWNAAIGVQGKRKTLCNARYPVADVSRCLMLTFSRLYVSEWLIDRLRPPATKPWNSGVRQTRSVSSPNHLFQNPDSRYGVCYQARYLTDDRAL